MIIATPNSIAAAKKAYGIEATAGMATRTSPMRCIVHVEFKGGETVYIELNQLQAEITASQLYQIASELKKLNHNHA